MNDESTDVSTPDSEPPSQTLAEALARRQIDLPADRIAHLDDYCRRLWAWNEKINLTRHTDYDKFVARDVVDSLHVAAELSQGAKIIDVGSGGGVPGIILAIVRPDLKVSLTDSMAKKARVLEDLVVGLKLLCRVHHGRGEDLLKQGRYDYVVVRAVASLEKLLKWFEPHWWAIGKLLVIKGPAWVEERQEARHVGLLRELELRKLAAWPLPGTDSESVLLGLWPKEKDAPAE